MPPSAIWDLFFESFYFRDYFHECVARVKIIENKMTRKINLILHELEVYVKRFIVWYKGIRSPLAIKPPIFTDESSQLSSKLYMFWFSTWTRCRTGHGILVFFRFDSVKYLEIKTKTKQKDLLAKDKNKQEETWLSITSL